MERKGEVLVGLDVGTSKVACVIAEVGGDGKVDVIGMGRHPSRGMRKGVVTNIEATIEAIGHAVQEAEAMSGIEVRSVITGIAGAHIESRSSHGVVRTRHDEVTPEDVQRVIDAAKAMKLPEDRQVLHVLPQQFIIDGQDGVPDPVGMSGVRLEVDVHVITAAASAVQNLIKCCTRCGLDVVDVVLEQLASAEAVLSDDEREMGVAVIDIGGGTTDVAVFLDGAIRYTGVVPIAGDHMTRDLVVGLRTATKAAEELKIRHGACLVELSDAEEVVEVPSVGGRPPRQVPRQVIAQILDARVHELFEYVRMELSKSNYYELLSGGVVLTGGASQLPGMLAVAEDVLGLQARLGRPQGVGGLSDVVAHPEYATSVGLLLYARRYRSSGAFAAPKRMGWWQRFKRWFALGAD